MGWYARWRTRRDCFHHDRLGGQTWILSELINLGAGKRFWCRECGRQWFA